MDLELVLTTILSWMRVQVTDASPWVQWAGAGYAVYWFFRGNWVTLRDFTKGLCWTVRKTGSGLQLANAWRKQPSRWAKLEERCKTLEQHLQTVTDDVYDGEEPTPERERSQGGQNPPPISSDLPELPESDADRKHLKKRALQERQADLEAQVARARQRPLDGGTYRGQIDPVFVGGMRINPKTTKAEQP